MRGGLLLLARATLRSRPPPAAAAAVLAPVAKTEMNDTSAADSKVSAAIKLILKAVERDGDGDWEEGRVSEKPPLDLSAAGQLASLTYEMNKMKAVNETGGSPRLIVYESMRHVACRLGERYIQQYEMMLGEAEREQWEGIVKKVCLKTCGKKKSSKLDMAKKSSEFVMGMTVIHTCLGSLLNVGIQAEEQAFLRLVMLPVYRAAANRYCSEQMVEEEKREMMRKVVAPECDTEVKRVIGEWSWLGLARAMLDGDERYSYLVCPEIDPGNDPVDEYNRLKRLRDVLRMFIESKDEHLRYFKRISVVALAELEKNVDKQRAASVPSRLTAPISGTETKELDSTTQHHPQEPAAPSNER